MYKKVFSIYDEKAEAYLKPFYLDTVGQAIRAVTDAVADPNHEFARHTSDFTLFQLASFDESKGVYKNEKHSLGNLVEFKAASGGTLHSITGDLEKE